MGLLFFTSFFFSYHVAATLLCSINAMQKIEDVISILTNSEGKYIQGPCISICPYWERWDSNCNFSSNTNKHILSKSPFGPINKIVFG